MQKNNASGMRGEKRKCVFMTLGFDAGIFMSSMAIHEILKNDKYIFIVPEEQTERGALAEREILTNIDYLKNRGISIEYEFLRIHEEEVWGSILQIAEKIREHRDYEIFIDLSGGMRCIIIITLLAAISSKNRIKKLVTIQEKKGQRIEVPLFLETPKTSKTHIIGRVAREPVTLEELSNELGRDESSVSRTLNKLVEQKFLERKRMGRTYIYTVSDLGKLHLITKDSTDEE